MSYPALIALKRLHQRVATFTGIGGSFAVEWVAAFVWIRWQRWPGIRNIPLPRADARLLRTPAGIWASLAQVLEAEFAKRSGIGLILHLDSVFCEELHLKLPVKDLMVGLFPERAARLNARQLADHLALSVQEANRLNLTDTAARYYFRDVALLLGSHFAADPIYPWAQAALDHPGDDATRISRLRTAFKVIVRRARAMTEGGA